MVFNSSQIKGAGFLGETADSRTGAGNIQDEHGAFWSERNKLFKKEMKSTKNKPKQKIPKTIATKIHHSDGDHRKVPNGQS